MTTLDELARIHGSDKWKHGYPVAYDEMFTPIRNDKIKLLEIGILDGASMHMWADYFPNAEIIGLDVKKFKMDLPRVTILQGDQANRRYLWKLGKQYGPFDIVIDDGGHTMNQQQTSLGILFCYVKPGGTYIIEDLHTSFNRSYNRSAQITTHRLIKRFQDRGRLRSRSIGRKDRLLLENHIAKCEIWQKGRSMFCEFKKKEKP